MIFFPMNPYSTWNVIWEIIIVKKEENKCKFAVISERVNNLCYDFEKKYIKIFTFFFLWRDGWELQACSVLHLYQR